MAVSGQRKVQFQVEYNYLFGLKETGIWEINDELKGFDINLTAMYNVNPRFAIGVGVGAEKLKTPNYTIIPVFAKATYALIKKHKSPYRYTKLGYSIGTEYSNSGVLFNPGIGYRWQLRKNFGIDFLLGYHLQNVQFEFIEMSDPETAV